MAPLVIHWHSHCRIEEQRRCCAMAFADVPPFRWIGPLCAITAFALRSVLPIGAAAQGTGDPPVPAPGLHELTLARSQLTPALLGATIRRATNTGAQKTSGQTNPRARLHQGDADLCVSGAPVYSRFIPPGGPSRPWQLIRFRRFRSSLLALASLDPACRDHCPDVSATFTTIAFEDSSSRWLGISDLIAEPEGPSFISRTVTHRRVDRRYS